MKEPHRMVLYHVSSKHMSFASPRFHTETMGEQKRLIPTVTVCAHDPNALLILLDAIHGRWNSVPRHMGLELLAKIMIIATQYKCTDALSICRDLWAPAAKVDLAAKPSPETSRCGSMWSACLVRLKNGGRQ
ncbi:uncharacterized protein BDV14DRAFT_174897 [Aspergillus stella-maris]|uniref:uncharacterized protein n=1 Tax=Aspergillus stella-maris TaxID=1810926 RepID=UPI003CCDDD71